jgi:hypothetical protein
LLSDDEFQRLRPHIQETLYLHYIEEQYIAQFYELWKTKYSHGSLRVPALLTECDACSELNTGLLSRCGSNFIPLAGASPTRLGINSTMSSTFHCSEKAAKKFESNETHLTSQYGPNAEQPPRKEILLDALTDLPLEGQLGALLGPLPILRQPTTREGMESTRFSDHPSFVWL